MPPEVHRGDAGSGLVGTTFGVGVFLLLLFFACHLLLNLWLMSTVDAVAHDAALAVALASPNVDGATAEARATARARSSLGSYATRVRISFEHQDPRRVVVRVQAPELRLLPAALADPLGLAGFDRRVSVAREDAR